MNTLQIMIGHEADAHWQQLTRFYQEFARDEGSAATLSADALKAAVQRQNAGYHLASITNHGLIAWTDHHGHPVEILDIFVERPARRQGLAQRAIAALIQQYEPDRAIQVAATAANTGAQRLYVSMGFQGLPAQLIFPPQGDQPSSLQYYDVESNEWLAATWPSMSTTAEHLDQAVVQGARRIWIEPTLETPPSWPRHPSARFFRLER